MKIDFGVDAPPLHQRTITIVMDERDLVKSNIPKAIRDWYSALKEHKMSDELFYLSEIAKGLE